VQDLSDISIWNKIKNGDTQAFRILYERYIDDLLIFGQKLSQNNDLIQDTIQQLFISLWDNRLKITPPSHSKAYLMKSLRNNLIRAIKKEQKIVDIDIDHYLKNIPGISISNIDDDKIRQIQAAVQNLPKRQQEIIHLRFYQEIKNKEIADIMGISYQSVGNLLQRAIKHIKLQIEKQKKI